MKTTLTIMILMMTALALTACDTPLGHAGEDHDHDGDGVQDHAAEDHDHEDDEHHDEEEGDHDEKKS